MSDIDTYDTQIAILNQVAEEMHKTRSDTTDTTDTIDTTDTSDGSAQNPQMTSFVHH